jgi:hypothetical protein
MHRRDFVRSLGVAAFALPSLELFAPSARAQSARLSRFAVFVHTNDGVHPPAFFPPAGTDPTNSPILSPLAPYKDKVLVMGAPLLGDGYPMAGTGLAYNGTPAQGRAAICLTGSQVALPLNPDQFNAVNKIDGPSIDYVIARALDSAPLLLGIHPIGGDTPSEVTFDSNGNPQHRFDAPADVLAALMAAPNMGDPAAALAKQSAITDFLNSRFKTVRAELSAYDRVTLDQHLAALRLYETAYTNNLMNQVASAGSCMPPSAAGVPTDPGSVNSGADTEFLAPFMLQSIAIAFACHRTRVATISFGYPGGGGAGGLRMPWLGFSDAQHGVSHNGGDPVQVGKYIQMSTWIVSQLKFLMDQLGAFRTPSGTLLDETTIYFFNVQGDGNAHTTYALPNIICGGTGGYFKVGQNLQLPPTNVTELLISLGQAMGLTITSFGSGPYAATSGLGFIAA